MQDNRVTGQAGRRAVSAGIRRALAAGDMAPGQRLIEQELSDTYQATRSAVREALQDLAAEGLVELVPRRGARVRVVSVDEAILITECRASLEGLCARRAAELATPEQRERLLAVGAGMREAVADHDLDRYSVLNRQLHDLVAEASGQTVAQSLLDRLNGQMVRHQFRLALRPGRPSQSLPQHLAIIDAVTTGDPAAAEAAANAHLNSVITELKATPVRGDAHDAAGAQTG
ncbi:GntR family transcriptional regulator [Streptomyces tsukubensis]|uniref:GntR family transcriptional regulator n=1 Tax=Streptomyces tsukubensis TaxID=83656 RepID=A0A1V4A9X2_9ACTN|nr:GntR family transcriptional regulator [Streptomyces tsukubensis]OON80104.1 GntR family transcriptional regulator [Streptomyces tsukubensis]QFR97334.1 FCD domain-containing protein [Streptomyces tsukubensis]